MLKGWGKATRDAEFTAFVEESTPRLVRLGVGLTGSGDAAREGAARGVDLGYS